jgi:hypothetical protein
MSWSVQVAGAVRFDGLMMADHIAALGATLEPKACENCHRSFQRKTTSTRACNPCRQMYLEVSGQLWRCVKCGTERKFGDHRPDETKSKKLHCRHCAAVTEHAFSRLSPRSVA